MAHSSGTLNSTRPPYMVNNQVKIFTPVGMAMIIVMMPKKALTLAPEPMRGAHHRLVAEQLLARERGGDFREDAERRQHQDVHLRMAPGPHQVHVHHRVATQRVGVEVEVQVAVQGERAQRHGEDREGGDDDHAGDQYRPGEHRHLHQGHARRTHAQDGDEQVDAGQQCSDTGGLQRPDVVVDTHPWTELDTRQRRIGDPAGHGEFANTQRDHHQRGADHEDPEAEGVEERERHVARADLQRHDDVHQADHERGGHEEDHDHAVRGEDLVVVFRWQEAVTARAGRGQLRAHHQRIGEATHQHDQRHHHVHDADLLVVHGGEPVTPQRAPQLEVRHRAEQREATQHHGRQCDHHDRLVQRHGLPRQFTQHVRYSWETWAPPAAPAGVAAAVFSPTPMNWSMTFLNSSGSTLEKCCTVPAARCAPRPPSARSLRCCWRWR
ncbi:hypothetical protein G6F57_015312 [Rhizopus arrhizus]|nr:hypothetical protein G6F57_015312 [Rhizopus arrhizus]